MKLNNFFPCIPNIFQTPNLSEQDRLRDLFYKGKSSRPGFVLRQCYVNLSCGIYLSAKYFRGFAPENIFYSLFIMQSPQNT